MKRFSSLLLLLLLPLLFAGCKQVQVQQAVATEAPPPAKPIRPIAVTATTYKDLAVLFAQHSYDMHTLDNGAPALVLEALPQDIATIPSIKEKKRLFFLALLPMVLMANQEIIEQRAVLQDYVDRIERGEGMTLAEVAEMRSISQSYRLKGDPINNHRTRIELLKRVDVLPPELVLAQAANESAWGTSRFAQLANNIFGEWTFTPGTGLVPEKRPEGAIYEVRKFSTLQDSLRSYMRNLNTNKAYRSLRNLRATLRYRGHEIDGMTLAAGLTRYSIRGQAYIRDLRKLMRQNQLVLIGDVNLRRR